MKWKTLNKFSSDSGMSKESIRVLKKKGTANTVQLKDITQLFIAI